MQTQDYRETRTTGSDERVLPGEWVRAIGRVPCSICGADYDDGHRGDRDHRFKSSLAGPGVSPSAVAAVAQVMAARASAKNGHVGEFFITDTELADRLDLAEKTVRRVRERMTEIGYLLRTRKGGGRSGRASDYRLTLPSVMAEHWTPETGVSSETLDMGALNTGHESPKHWTPETPQGVIKRDTRGERDARPADTSRSVVETPPRTNATTTNTPSSPVAAAVRRFPEQCERHQTGHHEPPCRGCQRAKEEHADALAAAARARSDAEAEENRRRAELTRAEIARCRYCDPGGRRLDAPSMICAHDAHQTERAASGIAAARGALAAAAGVSR